MKSNKVTDLMTVQQKAANMAEQADKVQKYNEWTTKDSQKYLDLTTRYTAAITALSNSAGSGGLGSFGF